MIVVSLLLNIVVLVGVTVALVRGARWTLTAYGVRTAARDILLAVYLAILFASIALLATVGAQTEWHFGALTAVLGLQITYKVLTVFTVRASLRNPVVLSNVGIAAVHAVTVVTIITSP